MYSRETAELMRLAEAALEHVEKEEHPSAYLHLILKMECKLAHYIDRKLREEKPCR